MNPFARRRPRPEASPARPKRSVKAKWGARKARSDERLFMSSPQLTPALSPAEPQSPAPTPPPEDQPPPQTTPVPVPDQPPPQTTPADNQPAPPPPPDEEQQAAQQEKPPPQESSSPPPPDHHHDNANNNNNNNSAGGGEGERGGDGGGSSSKRKADNRRSMRGGKSGGGGALSPRARTHVPATCPQCNHEFSVELTTEMHGVVAPTDQDVSKMDFLSDIHILGVDDDTLTRTILKKLLTKSGYKATCVGSGKEALEFLNTPDNKVDIVLSDIMMPEMNGHELLHAIKSSPTLQHLPVIMMSANEDKHEVFHCIKAGAEDYLIKPVKIDSLKNIWQHVWRKRNQVMFLSLLEVEKKAKEEVITKMKEVEGKMLQLHMEGKQAKSDFRNTMERHKVYEEELTRELAAMSKQSNIMLNHFRKKMNQRSVGVQCDFQPEGANEVPASQPSSPSARSGGVAMPVPPVPSVEPPPDSDQPPVDDGMLSREASMEKEGEDELMPLRGDAANEPKPVNDPLVVCRICEENVRASVLEKHSGLCLIQSRLTVKIQWHRDRLQRIGDVLQNMITNMSARELTTPRRDLAANTMTEAAKALESAVRAMLAHELREPFSESQLAEWRATFASVSADHKTLQPHCQRIASVMDNLTKALRELERTDVEASPILRRESSAQGKAKGAAASSLRSPGFEDFEVVKSISQGGCGKVVLAKKKATGDLYAIKVIDRKSTRAQTFKEQIRMERNILRVVDNPHVVKLFYSFQTAKKLCLVMEYLNGGDCMALLTNIGYLSEDHARFYIAETALAIHFLHSAGIVHRDIKPDNMLIGPDGHIKLTDFGLSSMGAERDGDFGLAKSNPSTGKKKKEKVLGTPDYVAPEMLLDVGSGRAADFWSLGVVTYELLTGIPPFNSATPAEIFDNILNRRIMWPSVPDEMSYEAQDLIAQLLTPNPSERLDFEGMKRHAWFSGLDWDKIRDYTAPFVPDEKSWYFEGRGAKLSDDEGEEEEDDAALSLSDSDDMEESFNYRNLEHLSHMNQSLLERNAPLAPKPPNEEVASAGQAAAATAPLPRRRKP